jgi:hypothetical protein
MSNDIPRDLSIPKFLSRNATPSDDEAVPEIRLAAYSKIDYWRDKLDRTPKLDKRATFECAAEDLFLEAEYERDLGAVRAIADAVYFLGRDHAGLDDDTIQFVMDGAKNKAERPINDRASSDEEPPPPNGPADYYANDKPDFVEAHKKRLLQSSREFTASYVPLDYLVDGLILEAFLYSLTGATGAGKTTITLCLAASVGLGIPFANRTTKKRRVLYLAAENPVDIRMRWIALAQQMDFDPDTIEVYFVEGGFRISQTAARLKAEAAERGGEFGLVIVDTSPMFYEGDDENNRAQQGRHAELLRSLIDIIPGSPAVIANCHPVKHAAPDNLLPAGGGNFLNQVDGNLTAARTDSTTELHTQGKFRGPDFAPLHFMLRTVTHERLVTSTGRLIPAVVCDWISDTAKEEIAAQKVRDEDLLLAAIDADPKASTASLATKLKWMLYNGEPNRMKVSRMVKALKGGKLITETRGGKYRLTEAGKKALKGSQTGDNDDDASDFG